MLERIEYVQIKTIKHQHIIIIMTKKIITIVVLAALLGSCVSKKKYVELEQDLSQTKGELQQTTLKKKNWKQILLKLKRG